MSRTGGRPARADGMTLAERDVALESVPRWVRADLVTGDGLADALRGVAVVVHAASAPARHTRRTDVEGTHRLLDAAHRAGVQHLLYVSIVGVDAVPLRYYAHKLAAEALVRRSPVPWSILRSTQFFPFVDVLCRMVTRFPVAIAPRGWLAQPVDVRDVADRIWNALAAGPGAQLPEMGGPERLTAAELLRTWMRAKGRRVPLVELPIPGGLSRAMQSGGATTASRSTSSITWSDWLRMTDRADRDTERG